MNISQHTEHDETYWAVTGLIIDMYVGSFHKWQFLELNLEFFGSVMCHLNAFVFVQHYIDFDNLTWATIIGSDCVDLLDRRRVCYCSTIIYVSEIAKTFLRSSD